ncbi:MAG: hypothetical protein CENE_01844 [Candidatus Celerinatantimonas neptuna]|nr:MAG: hypothetical protein CENE_01844 [Candidatus Celerinatantimonas neptuna]
MKGNFREELCVLNYISKDDIKTDPFPHVIKKNLFPEPIISELVATKPSWAHLEKIHGPLNGRWRYGHTPKHFIDDPETSQIWLDFLATNSSPEFYRRYIQLFGSLAVEYSPNYRDYVDVHLDSDFGLDGYDTTVEKKVVLDGGFICYPCNPNNNVRFYRGPHLDRPFKLYAGLLYIKEEGDTAKGGGLGIYKFKDASIKISEEDTKRHETFGDLYDFEMNEMIEVDRLEYETNTFIFYPQNAYALHGVLERERSNHIRSIAFISADVAKPHYRLCEVYK